MGPTDCVRGRATKWTHVLNWIDGCVILRGHRSSTSTASWTATSTCPTCHEPAMPLGNRPGDGDRDRRKGRVELPKRGEGGEYTCRIHAVCLRGSVSHARVPQEDGATVRDRPYRHNQNEEALLPASSLSQLFFFFPRLPLLYTPILPCHPEKLRACHRARGWSSSCRP